MHSILYKRQTLRVIVLKPFYLYGETEKDIIFYLYGETGKDIIGIFSSRK